MMDAKCVLSIQEDFNVKQVFDTIRITYSEEELLVNLVKKGSLLGKITGLAFTVPFVVG